MHLHFGFIILVILACSHSAPIEKRVDYTGHKVLRLLPESEDHIRDAYQLISDPFYDIDLWGQHGNGSFDIQVPPHSYDLIMDEILKLKLGFDVIIEDLQRLIDQENYEELETLDREKRSVEETSEETTEETAYSRQWHPYNFTRGHPHPLVGEYGNYYQIMGWLERQRDLKPNLVQLQDIGKSYEGRDIKVVKIGTHRPNKSAIWIDAGIHAREWIAPATAVYIINYLLESYGVDPNVTSLVNEFDWYFLPVANPDGYQYTHTVDRVWRKTRSRQSYRWYYARYQCQGVDANRNFDYEWLGHCVIYQCRSRNPCDATYAGQQPFSEPETIAMANFILRNQRALKMYLSLHSYSQMWLTPWGNTANPPEDVEDLMRVAQKGADALREVHGTNFEVGSPARILYPAGGGSYDWAKAIANIKYSYTLELRDRGRYGFLLPKSDIIPVGEETWTGINAAIQEMILDDCWMHGVGCRNVSLPAFG